MDDLYDRTLYEPVYVNNDRVPILENAKDLEVRRYMSGTFFRIPVPTYPGLFVTSFVFLSPFNSESIEMSISFPENKWLEKENPRNCFLRFRSELIVLTLKEMNCDYELVWQDESLELYPPLHRDELRRDYMFAALAVLVYPSLHRDELRLRWGLHTGSKNMYPSLHRDELRRLDG